MSLLTKHLTDHRPQTGSALRLRLIGKPERRKSQHVGEPACFSLVPVDVRPLIGVWLDHMLLGHTPTVAERGMRQCGMRQIADRLAELPGVVAVTLGGSRAAGTAGADSDWDFGLYYRGSIDPDDVRTLGWPGEVSGPGDWGRIVNGGAWLQIDGVPVDLIYRDLDEVLRWTAEAEQGRFEIQREVGYVAGIPTYLLAGELALCEVLTGSLPRPGFPERLKATAPPLWFQLAAGALRHAHVHIGREDDVAAIANLGQAVLASAHGRLAAEGQWALNEKQIVARAGLGHATAIVRERPIAAAIDEITALLDLPAWQSSVCRVHRPNGHS